MPITTAAALVAAVREAQLLEPAQFDELTRQLQPRFADPRALARELVRRGWLTPYQINQVFLGRGARLLLGQYVLLERLGEGGMGEVFKARHRRLGRVVALKVIRKDCLSSDLAVRRFRREVQAAGQLVHPNVVHAYDAGEAGGTHFFAMEYVEGTDLARLVKERGPLPVEQACDLVRQAALGLQHAFERGLVHRDIKPHNLLLSPAGDKGPGTGDKEQGTLKILDMGLARLRSDDGGSTSMLTQEGAVMGTPDFIAPEQAMNAHAADVRADLYSLGCTFYFLLTGRVPFPGGSAMEKLLKHQTEWPQAVESLRPDVPPAVAAVVSRLLAKRPDDRFQAPAELAAALAPAHVRAAAVPAVDRDAPTVVRLAAAPAAAPEETIPSDFASLGPGDTLLAEPRAASPANDPARRRRLLLNAAGGAALLALLGLLAVVVWRLNAPPRDTGAPKGGPTEEDVKAQPDRLLAREKDGESDPAQLWDDVIAFRRRHPARAREAHLGDLLLRLPSPLAALDPKRIPQGSHFDGMPPELVAVPSAGLPWHGITAAAPHVAFATDRSCIYCLTAGGGVAVCDPVTGRLGRRFGAGAAGFDLRPDGRRVLLRCLNTVPVWDLSGPGPREMAVLKGFPGRVSAVRYARDGKSAAVAVDAKPPVIQLWDLSGDEPKPRASLKGHTAGVGALDFSPDGQRLASASTDKTVRLWDLTADPPQSVAVLEARSGKHDWAESVSFSPDGRLLAWTGAHDWLVHVWDVAAGPPKELYAFPMGTAAEGVTFSPDGKALAAGTWAGTAVLWDVNGKAVGQRAAIAAHTKIVWSLSFSPDGQSLATAGDDGTLRVWDVGGKGPKEKAPRLGHAGRITGLAFAPDGKSLLSGSADGTARLWELTGAEPRERGMLTGHRGPVTGVAFAADGSPVTTSASPRGHVFLWDTVTVKPRDLSGDAVPGPIALAGTPDGRGIAGACPDHRVRLWDLTREPPALRTADVETSFLHPLALTDDGRVLSAGYEDGTVRLIDAAALPPRESGALHAKGHVLALAFAPDGKTLASAGNDFGVTLWDVAGRKPAARLEGHTGQVRGLAFAPDGKHVASASLDRRVLLWDAAPAAKGPKPREWELPWPPHAVAFAPDGRHLAVGAANGAVLVLRLK